MLRATPSLSILRHEIRGRICAHCYRRPPDRTAVGPETVRPCEKTCPIFVNLAVLRKTAVLIDPMLRSRRDALRHRIDAIRADMSGSKTPKTRAVPDDDPLGHYRERVVDTVLDLVGET